VEATVDAAGNIAAISMAGHIDAKSGRPLSLALFVNDAGPLTDIGDTLLVFERGADRRHRLRNELRPS
jgi:hypothetical protein